MNIKDATDLFIKEINPDSVILMGIVMEKSKLITWYCKKCGKTYNLSMEEDEKTISMRCPNSKCKWAKRYRVKDKK